MPNQGYAVFIPDFGNDRKQSGIKENQTLTMKEKLQGNSCNFLDYPTTQIFASLINFATIKMIGEQKKSSITVPHPLLFKE